MNFKDVIKLRQTIRNYKYQQISESDLQEILFAGMSAPVSMKEYSNIIFTVVQNKELLSKISDEYNSSSDPLYGAPTLIIVSSKSSKVKYIDHLNVSCIIENILLSATNLGLGSVYLTSFLSSIVHNSSLLNELGIPNEYIPISAVGVGYPNSKIVEIDSDEIGNRIRVIRR